MIDRELICRCGHKVAAHGLFNGAKHCFGYMYDSFCKCKAPEVDNLKLLEEALAEKES